MKKETKLFITMNQNQALNQEEVEADLFISELLDSMEGGENNESTSLNASELVNMTEGEELGIEGPHEAVL
jgi:hypothetical protein